jgi:hypothetical protein
MRSSSWCSCPQVILTTRQPAACKSRSRARSRCVDKGRGRPWASRKARKRSSSSLRVGNPQTPRPRIVLSAAAPGRRGWRVRRAARERESVMRSESACSNARSRAERSSTAARSKRVRFGVVAGIPSTSVTSSTGRTDGEDRLRAATTAGAAPSHRSSIARSAPGAKATRPNGDLVRHLGRGRVRRPSTGRVRSAFDGPTHTRRGTPHVDGLVRADARSLASPSPARQAATGRRRRVAAPRAARVGRPLRVGCPIFPL